MIKLTVEEKKEVQNAVEAARKECDKTRFTGKRFINHWPQSFCTFTHKNHPDNDCLMCPVVRVMGIHCAVITSEVDKTKDKQIVLDALTQIEAAVIVTENDKSFNDSLIGKCHICLINSQAPGSAYCQKCRDSIQDEVVHGYNVSTQEAVEIVKGRFCITKRTNLL